MKRPEQAIHKAVLAQLKARAWPDAVYWHTPNGAKYGGKNPARTGAMMKSLGVLAGVSDFIIFHRRKLFALELKGPSGRPTESQLEFMSRIQKAGGYGVVAEGFDEAIRCLEFWGILRGQTQ